MTRKDAPFTLTQVHDKQTRKYSETLFCHAAPVEPILGDMDYTNTREVGVNQAKQFLLNS